MSAIAAKPAASVEEGVREMIARGLLSLAVAFTNVGAAVINNRVIQAGTAPKNIGWGTGTNAAAVTDTTLQTEAAPTTSGGRTVGTESRTTTTVTNDTYNVAGSVTAAGTVAITESGLLDAVTAGNLLLRAVYAAVNLVINDSIAYNMGLKQVPL